MRRRRTGDRRPDEIRTVISTMTVIKGVAMACAFLPAIDQLVSAVVGIAVALAVVASGLRWVLRRLRWWAEDLIDARAAAAWRANRRRCTDCNARTYT